MPTRKNLTFPRSALVLSLALGTLAILPSAPLNAPVLEAQGRGDLESQNRRLLAVFELAGVVFTDADERRGRLVVGVLDRDVEGLVRGRLRGLGIDSELVDVVETEPIFALATLRERSNEIVGGLQIRFSQFLCSLGFNAVSENGTEGFVTASHCSDRQGRVDGTTYYQPLDQVANDLIGTEIADPAYVRNIAGCPKGRKCRVSDANFSRAQGVRPFTLGAIARTTGQGSLEIDPAGPFIISSEGVAAVGATVDKVGRTTGWTSGAVSNTCVNTGVTGSTIVLLCQTFVTGSGVIVAGGDSGSPVFRRTGGGSDVELLGGLWGGNPDGTLFVYSPIANIRDDLGNLRTH